MNAQSRGIEVLRDVPVWAWFLLASVLITQAYVIFNDAKKRGRNAWAWGAFGLLNFPGSLIIYYIVMDILETERRGLRPPSSDASAISPDVPRKASGRTGSKE